MQKIFDVNNEEDMDLLWSILPDDVVRISPVTSKANRIEFEDDEFSTILLKINWHDKTEITRPINYGDMVGFVGWFWDKDNEKEKSLGVLTGYYPKAAFPFTKDDHCDYSNFRPAKKSELKFYGEDK
jgi:hypothetical protein